MNKGVDSMNKMMEMYSPSHKKRVMAEVVEGYAQNGKGGSPRLALKGLFEGKKTLPKKVDAETFEKYGFNAEETIAAFHAESVGEPLPESPLEDAPSTVPSPIEPTNANFSADNHLQGSTCNYCGSDNIRRIKGYKCMNCANEVNYHAEDSPSPSGPSEEPDPAEATGSEPSNENFSAESFNTEEPIVEEPAWIPAGDGRALGQQNSAINMSPLHAESFNADFGNPIKGDFTTMQVRIGSPSGSTTSWTTSFNIQCVGSEDNLSYLTSDIEDLVVDRVKRWNGDDFDGDQFGDFIPMQIVIGSSSGNSGSWYRQFTVLPVGDEDNLSYLTSDIEGVVVDKVKHWNGDEVSYNTDTVGSPSFNSYRAESFNAENCVSCETPDWFWVGGLCSDSGELKCIACCYCDNCHNRYSQLESGEIEGAKTTFSPDQKFHDAESQKSMILEACGICDKEFNAETLNADGYCGSCCDTRLAEFDYRSEERVSVTNEFDAESNEVSKNAQIAIGLTALGVGLALWKSDSIMNIIDKIKKIGE